MRFWSPALLVLGLSALTALAQPVPQINLSNADALGEELYRNSGSTGMVMVVVHDKQVFIGGYGQTAPGSGQRPRPDSVVRLCSLTKIFTTDTLAKLAADHTVSLTDPLQKFAPTPVPERKGQPITLEDLATHTAGLPRELAWLPDGDAHFTFPDYQTRWSWLPKYSLRSVPGTIASYSNIGFDLLSDALAVAAKKPYATVLDERTLKPLRMYETTYFPNQSQCERLLEGDKKQGPCTVTVNTEGSSGLYSTGNDMARWLKYLVGGLGPGQPAQISAATAPYLRPEQLVRVSGLNYAGDVEALGLGWVHVLPAEDPSHLVEKTGGGAGFLTYIAIHPATHSAIFVAASDGRSTHHAHFNLFRASNSVLLKLLDRPLIPEPGVGDRLRGGRANLRMVAARPGQKLAPVRGRGRAQLAQNEPPAPVRGKAGARQKAARGAAAAPAAKPAGRHGKSARAPEAAASKSVRKAAPKSAAKPGKTKAKSPAAKAPAKKKKR